MFRYVTLNSTTNENTQQQNKKNQKTVPISLLSGGNTFFVKIKSNQIASNYNDTGNKIKPNTIQKINNTYFQKEINKNKSYNKYLNNSQQKNSFVYVVNNSIEYNNNNTIVNKSKQDLFNHNKGIYSFTSVKHNDNSKNNKTINSTSLRHNYNGVLLTDVELLKKNMNKNFNTFELKQENKRINKDKNDINNNKGLNYRVNKKVISSKIQTNNNIISGSLNKRVKTLTDKNTSILTGINKSITNNNQMKLYRKNQYIVKNNRNNTKSKNLTSILINNNSSVEKTKQKTIGKDNFSEGKKIILHGQKKNKLICYKDLSDNNNSINKYKNNFIETDEFNSSISKVKVEKRIKSINIKPNNENVRTQNNNNSKLNFNNKSLVVPKKFYEKKNTNININSQHISNKSNNINNRNSKLINSLGSGEIFELNYTLTELIGPNSNNYKNRMNKQISFNDKNYSLKKQTEINKQKELKMGNKHLLSDLTSYNIDKHKIKNYPNIIINNNYLYNYIPLITLNNSADNDNSNNRLSLNRNSFINNKIENKKKYNINNSQNFQIDHSHACILNYSSFIGNNCKKINNNTLNKDNKNKLNKKYNNYDPTTKVNISDRLTQNNLTSNNSINNNNNNNKYNFHTKYISSSKVNNINNNNKTDYNLIKNRANSNNITECFVSKEKNKKQKQNPPLSKNTKKLNILSLIQENNRKIKDSNVTRQRQFHSFVENDNYNKCYNNKNVYETIDYILYPENYKIKDSIDVDVLDNFDDMNTIIRKINFDDIDLKSNNIFTISDNKTHGKKTENYLYNRYCETFNNIFDKKFLNRHQNMSANQNKIKINNYMYHSKQSGSTKDSNKDNSSTKKARVHSYLESKFEKK